MHDSSHTVAEFVAATAAKKPVPGGGSVAAWWGACGAAMVKWSSTTASKRAEPFADDLQAALGELTRARGVMLQLMVEDQFASEAMCGPGAGSAQFGGARANRHRRFWPAFRTRRRWRRRAWRCCISATAWSTSSIISCSPIWPFAQLVDGDDPLHSTTCGPVNARELPDANDRAGGRTPQLRAYGQRRDLIERVPRIWAPDARSIIGPVSARRYFASAPLPLKSPLRETPGDQTGA